MALREGGFEPLRRRRRSHQGRLRGQRAGDATRRGDQHEGGAEAQDEQRSAARRDRSRAAHAVGVRDPEAASGGRRSSDAAGSSEPRRPTGRRGSGPPSRGPAGCSCSISLFLPWYTVSGAGLAEGAPRRRDRGRRRGGRGRRPGRVHPHRLGVLRDRRRRLRCGRRWSRWPGRRSSSSASDDNPAVPGQRADARARRRRAGADPLPRRQPARRSGMERELGLWIGAVRRRRRSSTAATWRCRRATSRYRVSPSRYGADGPRRARAPKSPGREIRWTQEISGGAR